MILAGDIGGTKTNLGLFSEQNGRLAPVSARGFVSHEYSGLEALVREFLAGSTGVSAACFGVPGPVVGGEAKTTNLPWLLETAALKADLGISALYLINDLQATAWGLETLAPGDILELNPRTTKSAANAALIAAGTGLGEAVLFWDGRRLVPSASEGGHADFAPHNALETELYSYLNGKFGHVSWERVLSGPGFFNLYDFLKESGRGREIPAIRERMNTEDPAAVISSVGLSGECGLCRDALELFVSLYGAEAGNLALRSLSFGGLYVGGGIAPKIARKLVEGGFMKAFLAKGRMAPLLAGIPVRVVLNEKTALLGAARYAAEQTRPPTAEEDR